MWTTKTRKTRWRPRAGSASSASARSSDCRPATRRRISDSCARSAWRRIEGRHGRRDSSSARIRWPQILIGIGMKCVLHSSACVPVVTKLTSSADCKLLLCINLKSKRPPHWVCLLLHVMASLLYFVIKRSCSRQPSKHEIQRDLRACVCLRPLRKWVNVIPCDMDRLGQDTLIITLWRVSFAQIMLDTAGYTSLSRQTTKQHAHLPQASHS